MDLEAERFWTKVDRRGPDECWPWLASVDRHGYGQFFPPEPPKRLVRSHRWSYMAEHGLVPSTVHVLHSCDNPACVNPAHLFAGDQAANMADMKRKGRAARHGKPSGEAHPNHRLTQQQVDQIRGRYNGEYGQQAALGREFGVSSSAIHLIVKGVRWR